MDIPFCESWIGKSSWDKTDIKTEANWLLVTGAWGLRHCNDLLQPAEHNNAFLAASGIGDRLVRRINDGTDIEYETDLEDICWSHKLYILPLTLATAAVHNN